MHACMAWHGLAWLLNPPSPVAPFSYQAHGLAPMRRVHTLPPKLVERVFSGAHRLAHSRSSVAWRDGMSNAAEAARSARSGPLHTAGAGNFHRPQTSWFQSKF